MVLHLWGLPLKNSSAQTNREKKIKQSQIEGHITKYLINISQNFQGQQKQNNSEELS